MKKLILCLSILSIVSCSTKKDVIYFQDIDDRQFEKIDSLYDSIKIEPNDILSIRITAKDPLSIVPFMFEKSGSGETSRSNTSSRGSKLTGYVVGRKGKINYPQLGEIRVEGKTLKGLELELQGRLSAYIKDPTVLVRLVNNKVTVLGEVSSPGTIQIDEERYTLPQVLGAAGDLTIRGARDNITIIRNENGRRIIKHIDLTKSDWMNSPFYHLKQNDIVYVQPNRPRIKSAGYITSIGTFLSIISSSVSLILLIVKL